MARPVSPATGVTVIAALIALGGLASLEEAWELLKLGMSWVAVIPFAIGLLLMNRAYGLWKLRFQAYEITLVILVIREVAAGVSLLFVQFVVNEIVSLIAIGVAFLFLIRPDVRALFRGGGPT